MHEMFRTIAKLTLLGVGLLCIYAMLNSVIKSTNASIQATRDNNASAYIVSSYVSESPFGEATNVVKRNTQIFYNIQIQRHEGAACYVKTSWRWVLHLPTGNSVMWNKSDGEFYAGDKTESLAQAVEVNKNLLPGDYTLSRLAIFKCGDVDDFARTVRNIDLHVE